MVNKRSQMEIMGLAVIIILLTLAGLFVVRFVILKPVQVKDTYTMKSLATDTLTALLRTNTGCNDENIRDLLMDCATNGPISCRGVGSCEYVTAEINSIFDNSLNEWKKRYRFVASTNTYDGLIVIGNCTGATLVEPAIQPLPTYNNLQVRLDICE